MLEELICTTKCMKLSRLCLTIIPIYWASVNPTKVHDIEDVQLEEYDLILSKTIYNDQLEVSRVVFYKHQSLVGKVRDDLMSD